MFGSVDSPLVEKLVLGEHPIEVCTRVSPDKKREDLLRQISYDVVHVVFPDTKGGTELGINLQRDLCGDLNLSHEETDPPETLMLVGDLVLDWKPIRLTVKISTKDYSGTATVEKRDITQAD